MVKPVKFLNEFVAADYRILPWPAINTFYFIHYDKSASLYREEAPGLFTLVLVFFFRFLNGSSDK